MSQSGRTSFNVLLVLILLATITYADTDGCRKFCNKHRPDGSPAAYSITCAEVSGRNGTEMSSCKKECESCPELCSNENFRCPRTEEAFLIWYSYTTTERLTPEAAILGTFFIIGFFCCPVCICGVIIWAIVNSSRTTPAAINFGMQPVGAPMPMYQQLPYQPQVGGFPGMGQPQNYPTS